MRELTWPETLHVLAIIALSLGAMITSTGHAADVVGLLCPACME